MSEEFHFRRRIEFCETDAAGIAHFSAFFQYMEQAEHALLRHCGFSVLTADGAGSISWPRVNAACEFSGAVKFEEELDIHVCIERLGTKSVTYAFDMRCGDRRVATGKMTSVCCRIASGQPPQSLEIPAAMAGRLRTYLCPASQ